MVRLADVSNTVYSSHCNYDRVGLPQSRSGTLGETDVLRFPSLSDFVQGRNGLLKWCLGVNAVEVVEIRREAQPIDCPFDILFDMGRRVGHTIVATI